MEYTGGKRQSRIQEQNIENIVYANYKLDSEGIFEMPKMERVEMSREELENTPLQSFDYVLREKQPEKLGVHFFTWDYKFERVWNYPDRYTGYLQRFKFVLSPDFSVYRDIPNALQIFNAYRNRWCGKYWQEHGIKVIPTFSLGNPDFFKTFCDGIPKHSVIATSTMGDGRWGNYKMLKASWNLMLHYLEPELILLYGRNVAEELHLDGNIVFKRQVNTKVAV